MATKRKRTTEGSCWGCKKRRVLCDLTRPACNRCTSRQQLCEYAHNRIRWVDGVASRGKLAGRSVPVASSPLFSLVRPLDDDDSLLLYFERQVLPRFNLAPDPLEFDITSIAHDRVLQRAATAVAKAHFAMDGKVHAKDDVLSITQSRLSALSVYREHFEKQDATQASMESLFLTNILFCILDGIIEPEQETSAMSYHFNGGKAMLNNWVCLRQLDNSRKGLESLAMSIYATMDLVYSLLSGSEPYFKEEWFLNRYDCSGWWGNLGEADVFLELLAILSKLGQLGYVAHSQHESAPIDDLFKVQSSLEKLSFRIDSLTEIDPSVADGEVEIHQRSWAAFCSAYRQTALIYMYRALCNLEVDHELVQQAVHAGVNAICGQPLTGKLAHCLLFPSLIVGAHCVEPTQRDLLRKSLLSTASYLSFGSIQIMDAFLQEMWKAKSRDFDWWVAFRDLANQTSLF